MIKALINPYSYTHAQQLRLERDWNLTTSAIPVTVLELSYLAS